MTGLAANKQPQMTSASRHAGKWGEHSGAGSHEGGLRPTYCPYPTYRLCLSLSLPTPLICNTQFSPKLTFFFFYFIFTPYFPTMISSPNPLYRHCSANLSVTYSTPNPYVPFPEGNEGGLASHVEAQRSPRKASS